jgi:hypothetical protein
MPKLVLVTGSLPAPPYPATLRANGYRFDLDVERVKQSDTYNLCPPEIRPWLWALWCESWLRVPCGTYTNDDEVMAAAIGMPINLFRMHQKVLLRGWTPHSDGRLYHSVITERALAMHHERERWARNKKAQRATQPAATATEATEVKNQPPTPNVPEDSSGSHRGVSEESSSLVLSSYVLGVTEKQKEKGIRAKRVNGHASSATPDASRGTRFRLTALPDDWRKHINDRHPELDADAVFEGFSDFWRSRAGANARKVDWFLTWKVWTRKDASEQPRRRISRGMSAQDVQNLARELADKPDEE